MIDDLMHDHDGVESHAQRFLDEQLRIEKERVSVTTFDDYQAKARETSVYPGQGQATGLMYAALGLNGEAGEVAERVKKLFRDWDQVNSVDYAKRCDEIAREMGDVLWYLAAMADEIGESLSDIASGNLRKLNERFNADLIHGEGSDREILDEVYKQDLPGMWSRSRGGVDHEAMKAGSEYLTGIHGDVECPNCEARMVVSEDGLVWRCPNCQYREDR